MRISSIASGSSGNCIYVGSDNTHILIDAGISNKRIEEGLNKAGLTGSDLTAVCITHEHSDHIKSLGILSRKYHIPMYATKGTIEAVKKDETLGKYDKELFNEISADEELFIGDICVKPFHTYHDAADPVGYRFHYGNKNFAIATDTGHFDDYLINNLLGLDSILIESNHDVRMLETGSYPYYLKRRILSDVGHLSNETCGRLLSRILGERMQHVLLGHLSKENNFPDLAFESVKVEILESDCCFKPQDFDIRVACRDNPSDIFEL